MVDSEDSFAVELGYTLASGELIPLDINFYGKGYGMGVYARDDSNIRLTAQDSDLWRATKTITRDMSWTGLDVPQNLKTAATEKVNLNPIQFENWSFVERGSRVKERNEEKN